MKMRLLDFYIDRPLKKCCLDMKLELFAVFSMIIRIKGIILKVVDLICLKNHENHGNLRAYRLKGDDSYIL